MDEKRSLLVCLVVNNFRWESFYDESGGGIGEKSC
jgi:hypothetical protein